MPLYSNYKDFSKDAFHFQNFDAFPELGGLAL